MKNINNVCDVLILVSIAALFEISNTDAWRVQNGNDLPWKKNQFVDGMIVYPDDGYIPEPRKNVLSIYNSELMIDPEPDNRLVTLLTSRLSDFHAKLTSTILANKPGKNVVYSPIGVSMLLTVMAYGGRHNTSDEILNNLGINIDYHTHVGYHQLGGILKNPGGVVLNFVNKIFTSTDFKLDWLFKWVSEKVYLVNTQEVDFSDTDETASEINNWCEKEINNHIKGIVDADGLNDVSMVLANAIYFEGSWDITFDPAETQVRNFHINEDKSVLVPMMFQSDAYNYAYIKELDAHYIELPYKHKNDTNDYFSMYLLVPMEIDGLELIEKNLDLIDFKRLDATRGNVNIFLPKFRIEHSVDLSRVLHKMGIKNMFTRAADFSGMTDSDVHVSKMIQNAYLEVDELGSKATGVTAASMGNGFFESQFTADKPFLCAIVVKSLGMPFVFARIADPTQLL